MPSTSWYRKAACCAARARAPRCCSARWCIRCRPTAPTANRWPPSACVPSASAEEARHLQLAEGAALIELSTLRLLDGEPVSLIRHRYCASHAERLADYQGGSLRRYLGERDLPLTRRFSLIGARLADRDEAAQLLMPLRMPLLSVFTLSCDASGRPVEIALSASRSDRFQYQVAT